MLVSIQPPTTGSDLSAHVISSLPVLVLDLHSRCQCKCVMCDIWKNGNSEELSLELLRRNRDAIRKLGVRWVVLSGGEPLLHSRFIDICAFLRDEGVRITLLTAGMSLKKHAGDVARSVDDVIVSLDGPRAIHDHIRGIAGAFDLLATGVLTLLSQRPEMEIRARTTVQKLNYAVLRETVEATQELDLSGISFLAADLTSTAFHREEPWRAPRQASVALNSEEMEGLEAEIAKLIAQHSREIASGYIAESPAKLRRIADHFRAHAGQRMHRAPMCNAPWVSAVIGHDGSVRPCFFHPPIGSLAHESLDAAVNSSRALQFREGLDIDSNSTCKQCVCSLYRPENAAGQCLQTSDKSDIGV